jgi:hypothetical protein
MFKFEGYCDDMKVHRFMRAAAGLVVDFKIVPVVNAIKSNGKVKAQVEGDLLDLFLVWIKKHKAKELTVNQIQTFLGESGRSEGGHRHLINRAQEAKALKRKARGVYQVLQ